MQGKGAKEEETECCHQNGKSQGKGDGDEGNLSLQCFQAHCFLPGKSIARAYGFLQPETELTSDFGIKRQLSG
ncbi:hypothetical protein SDC9_106806 [bioreactor metagenome]|uniref:Uncharacterized protein n=1 Tax=bioreactor metagenome TaxID=1076179 RepID=A0A645B3B9_9ZZZZ